MAERACPRAGQRENGVSKPWDGRSPTSIAAALIYLVTSLPKVWCVTGLSSAGKAHLRLWSAAAKPFLWETAVRPASLVRGSIGR